MKIQNISGLKNSNFNQLRTLNNSVKLLPVNVNSSYSASGAQALAIQNIAFGNMQQKDYREETIDAIKEVIKPAIEEEDVAGIFNALGYGAYTDEDGYVTLKNDFESGKAYNDVSFEELGIDEQMLFNKIKRIKGECFIDQESDIESTGALEHVDKGLYIYGPVQDVPNLKYIGEDARFSSTISGYDIKRKLTIKGTAVFCDTNRGFEPDDQKEFKNVKAKNIIIDYV